NDAPRRFRRRSRGPAYCPHQTPGRRPEPHPRSSGGCVCKPECSLFYWQAGDLLIQFSRNDWDSGVAYAVIKWATKIKGRTALLQKFYIHPSRDILEAGVAFEH